MTFDFDVDDNSDKTVITDIKNWSHPTKQVFEKYNFTVVKVELLKKKTYPVFYVKRKTQDISINDERMLTEIAAKNGYWDFKIVVGTNSVEVRCDKKKRNVIKN